MSTSQPRHPSSSAASSRSSRSRGGSDALLGQLAQWRLSRDRMIDEIAHGQRTRALLEGLHGAASVLARDEDPAGESRTRAALRAFGEATGVFEVAVFEALEPGGTRFQMVDAWTLDTGGPHVPGRVIVAEENG